MSSTRQPSARPSSTSPRPACGTPARIAILCDVLRSEVDERLLGEGQPAVDLDAPTRSTSAPALGMFEGSVFTAMTASSGLSFVGRRRVRAHPHRLLEAPQARKRAGRRSRGSLPGRGARRSRRPRDDAWAERTTGVAFVAPHHSSAGPHRSSPSPPAVVSYADTWPIDTWGRRGVGRGDRDVGVRHEVQVATGARR